MLLYDLNLEKMKRALFMDKPLQARPSNTAIDATAAKQQHYIPAGAVNINSIEDKLEYDWSS